MPNCQNCNTTIDQEEIYNLNKDLITRVDSGEQEELTPLEQALYQGVYCGKCCTDFKAGIIASCVLMISALMTRLNESMLEQLHTLHHIPLFA